MVQYESELNGSFAALSDPTRRAILERLGRGSATISELAEDAGMSLTGLKKHVQILEQSGLVTTAKHGRTRHCRLGPRRLDDASQWLESYRRSWADRFDRMEDVIERKRGQRS
jgi:DNA-binding transcriptional ArsR family regulator